LDAWNIAKPAVFLIDRSGEIRYSFVGDRQGEFPSSADIDSALEAIAPVT
jgi:hypothetical protein